MNHGNFKLWRLFVVALESEAQKIIDYYKLLQVNNRTISEFNGLSRKMLGPQFHTTSEKFSIYLNPQDYNTIGVIISGVGKSNAAAATAYGIMVFNPSQIINVGMCGSLKGNSFKRGDVVEVLRIFQHDMYIPIKGEDFDYLMEPIDLKTSIRPKNIDIEEESQYTHVILATGDSFIDDSDKKNELGKIADVVDMEGYAIARVCDIFNINLKVYKVISDDADEKAEFDFNTVLKIYNDSIYQFLQRV